MTPDKDSTKLDDQPTSSPPGEEVLIPEIVGEETPLTGPVGIFAVAREILELIRFSHTVFALPFALLSALLAWQVVPFQWNHLWGVLLCMVFARSAAMAFNRIVDRKIDEENPRTMSRHLPAGRLSLRVVTAFTVVCSVGFVLSTLLFLPNKWPIILSVPVLAFLLTYSYAKRFTSFCHYWLSAALMLSPIATWIAIAGTWTWPPILLAGVIFFWVGGFDILYATQDAEFDKVRKLHSIPARLGIRKALWVAFLSHLLTIACLFAFWSFAGMGWFFLAGTVAVSLLLLYEHWLVRPEDLKRVNVAFFNVNAVISLGLLLFGAIDLWLNSGTA
ncbi:MAG: putative 4-hydroxybenzoate polyprenyltransferase [Planctomycetaceae bacterium]|nr:putative 4-hydroxybenzoate polyprenyltransferase [Planctomycetaceae bacterium]